MELQETGLKRGGEACVKPVKSLWNPRKQPVTSLSSLACEASMQLPQLAVLSLAFRRLPSHPWALSLPWAL